MIEVIRAPVHLLVQDSGFSGCREIGLPRAGAMDISALRRGNKIVGNDLNAAALEWAISGGTIRFADAASIALTGARVHGRLGRQMIANNRPYEAPAGSVLEIDRISDGRFLYLCISPQLDVPPVFRSSSTYVPARIGGFQGRRLKSGDVIPSGSIPSAEMSEVWEVSEEPDYKRSTLSVVRGPQSDALDGRLLEFLLTTSFTVSYSSDRTGFRLDGPRAPVAGLEQILSEPACEGAVQITDGGSPVVLMADGPTIGGYNKVAVVIGADLPILAQKMPGETVRFALNEGSTAK